MNIKEKIAFWELCVQNTKQTLDGEIYELHVAKTSIENHIYESIEKAEGFLYNQFDNEAADDCEGSGNCGNPEYEQDFIVDGKEYTAIGKFEYDRYDKQYYYVDSREYFVVEKA